MAKINAMMDIGKRSMMNSQTALQTTAHNIANKTTEGYSRQRVELVTAPPVNEGRYQIGMGSRAAGITRTNNPYLEKQIQRETGQMGFFEGRSESLARVEQVFNEQSNKGLNQYVTDFFNAFRELSNTPESVTTRTMVKETAEAMVNDFKRVKTQLTDVQKDADMQVRFHVEEINKMTREIGQLNEQIAQVEIQGTPANDQRDRRDLLLKQLNQKIDIKYAEGDQGMVTVSTAGNALLVSGMDHSDLTVATNPDNGHSDIFYQTTSHTTPFKVSERIKGGSLGAILEVRDKTVEEYKGNIDTIAETLADEVNSAHLGGFDRYGNQGAEFFTFSESTEGGATNLNVNSLITQDVGRIAAGARPNAPGDNTVANVISMIQYKQVLDDKSATLDDYYNSQVGKIGVAAQRANKSRDAQANVLQQLDTVRESVSGVSLDEEATKMIEFQKAFDASARVIRTADEMFDTVLNLKRL